MISFSCPWTTISFLRLSKKMISKQTLIILPMPKRQLEKKEEILENLKKMASFLDGERNRSEEWKRFKRSVDKLNSFELQNSDDSRLNGEDLFEEIFNSSVAYMKERSTVSMWSDEAMTGTPRDYMLTILVQDV